MNDSLKLSKEKEKGDKFSFKQKMVKNNKNAIVPIFNEEPLEHYNFMDSQPTQIAFTERVDHQ